METGILTEVPVRHGKSEYYGRYFPAWYLGRFPNHRIGYVSYGGHQARKYGRFSRDVFQRTAPYLWGLNVRTDSKAANEWNIQGYDGGMETSGIYGEITGKGFHVLIIDDPIKNDEQAVSELHRDKCWEWFHSTATTRLEPGGFIIVNMTRWHVDDLIGRIRSSEEEMGNWDLVSFPAIAEDHDILGRQPGDALWPLRYPLTTEIVDDPQYPGRKKRLMGLDRIKASKPLYWWNCLYQQHPSQHSSVEWPPEYFTDPVGCSTSQSLWFDEWPTNLTLKALSLDPSKGKTRYSDYSAFILMGQTSDKTIWIEADMDRRPAGKIVSDGVAIIKWFKPEAFGIEANAWQDLLQPLFRQALPDELFNKTLEILLIDNRIAKEIRIRRLDPFLRLRRFKFRNNKSTRLLVNQLKEFPMAAHDDGPDGLEMVTRIGHYLLTADLDRGMSLSSS